MRKSPEQIIDDCDLAHRMELHTTGTSLALSVTIPRELSENDYDITGCDSEVISDLLKAVSEALGTEQDSEAHSVVTAILNAGLLVRRRTDK